MRKVLGSFLVLALFGCGDAPTDAGALADDPSAEDADEAPTVIIEVSPAVAAVGEDVGLTYSVTDDRGLEVVSIAWGTLDTPVHIIHPTGTREEGHATHTYQDAGNYVVQVSATDTGGQIVAAGRQITITAVEQNQPPIAALTVNPASGPAPLTVQIGLSCSDTDGTVTSYELDADGDGSFEVVQATAILTSRTYDSNATVRGRCVDNDGQLSSTATQLVTIVQSAGRLVYSDLWDIYTINPDGSDFEQLTFDGYDVYESTPAWSPDGSRIAFSRNAAGIVDVWVMNTDGTGLTNLTRRTDSADMIPAWSPDGSTIAFTSDRSGTEEIYFMDSDGSNQRRFLSSQYGDNLVDWSPDGSKLAFQRYYFASGVFRTQIMTVHADGSNLREIIRNSADQMGPSDPRWSPDGTQLVFRSPYGGHWQIFTANSNGSNIQRITNASAESAYPVWSPDGTQIAFVRTGGVWITGEDGSSEYLVPNTDFAIWVDWKP